MHASIRSICPPVVLTAAITKSLDELVAEAKSQTAAGAGLSGARHVADASATVDGKNGVREQLDVLVDRVKGLRKLTAEATLFLPVYDLRRAQEVRRDMMECD